MAIESSVSIEFRVSCEDEGALLSVELDDDLNEGRTCFLYGEKVYFRVYHSLNLTITEHPDGGKQVNQVSAKFEGAITGTITPVSVTVEWWWEDGNHENSKMVESEEIIFNSGNVTIKSTIYKAPASYFLLNYYWAKFTWTDDNGQHEIKTSKAYCTSK